MGCGASRLPPGHAYSNATESAAGGAEYPLAAAGGAHTDAPTGHHDLTTVAEDEQGDEMPSPLAPMKKRPSQAMTVTPIVARKTSASTAHLEKQLSDFQAFHASGKCAISKGSGSRKSSMTERSGSTEGRRSLTEGRRSLTEGRMSITEGCVADSCSSVSAGANRLTDRAFDLTRVGRNEEGSFERRGSSADVPRRPSITGAGPISICAGAMEASAAVAGEADHPSASKRRTSVTGAGPLSICGASGQLTTSTDASALSALAASIPDGADDHAAPSATDLAPSEEQEACAPREAAVASADD